MRDIILFGGTTEGKCLAEYMEQRAIPCYVSVATEYGKEVLPSSMVSCRILTGMMTQPQMEAFLLEKSIRLVLDATHPYAVEVTRNIAAACGRCGIPCIRIKREVTPAISGAVYVSSVQAAAAYLDCHAGNALLTTGSKELSAFLSVTDYQNRLYARILPVEQMVEKAKSCGFSGTHLLCGRGPFTVEQNVKMIADCHAKYLVTKDTGKEGGFPEKAEAAKRMGICLLVIRRPVQEQGMTVEEAQFFIRKKRSHF